MTRADRLYRVWLERELGRITTEEAFERVERVMREPAVLVEVRWRPPIKRGCAGCGCPCDEQTSHCLTCHRRHQKRKQYARLKAAA